MRYTVPDYYGTFSCIAGACPDTCCAGWQIVIDEHTLEKYKKESPPFGNRLQNEINWSEGVFQQYNGKCAFLDNENLCDIYSEMGKDKLCRTCKTYPRHIEEYEGIREISLSMSCPEAARIILQNKKRVTFLDKEIKGKEEEYEEFDYLLYTKLVDSRAFLIQIMQHRQWNSRVRMAILMGFAHDMQGRILRKEMFAIDSLIKRYAKEETKHFFEAKQTIYLNQPKERFLFMYHIFCMLQQLEPLKEEWADWVKRCKKQLFYRGSKEYARKLEQFRQAQCKKEKEKKEWERIEEQIIVYFLFSYYCGAIYDENVYVKVKMAILSVLVIEEMLFAKWLSTGKIFDSADWIALAYQYSRELEHSDLNLNKMEKILTKKKEFGLQSFLYGIYQ